ncbi:MAG TPA: hypothetical protein VGX23_34210 [Actinocrinis sp.]|nr:hypothetical protein [Actinocrinis sp.]
MNVNVNVKVMITVTVAVLAVLATMAATINKRGEAPAAEFS